MPGPLHVIVVEDSPDDYELILLELRRGGFAPTAARVETAQELRTALEQPQWQIVLSDYTMPGFDAIGALRLLQSTGRDLPFIVISGTIGEELAVQTMKSGADDYLLKKSLVRLAPTVERALREAEGRRARKLAERDAFRLAAIVQSSEDAISSKNLNGIITSWNAAAERLYQWTAAEMIGQSVDKIVPPAKKAEFQDIMQRLRQGERLSHFETLRVRKDGTIVDVSLTISPIRDANGNIIGASTIARDIRERKRAEALQRFNNQLLSQTHDAVVTTDLDGRITSWNTGATRLHGFEAAEMIGQPITSIYVDSRTDPLEIVKVLNEKGNVEIECPFRRKNGGPVFLHVSISLIRDEYGQPVGTIGYGLDISERKRNEEKLKRDAFLLAAVRDSVIVTDLEGIVTYWNEGATRLFGWTSAEMLGKSIAERVPPASRAAVAEQLRSIAAGQEFVGEWLDHRKDGSPIWVDARVSRIVDADGKPVGIIGLAHDISERKKVEEALRQSEEQYHFLAESFPLLVWMTRPDGHTDYVNRRWQVYTGGSADNFLGQNWVQWLHRDDRARATACWERAVQTGEPYEIEYRLRRADGVYRWHTSRGVPLRNHEGRIIRWFGTATDIHDVKLAEEQKSQLARHIRLLLESTGEGIYGVCERGLCTFINRAGAAMLGYTPEELVGKDIHRCAHHTRPDGCPYPIEECPVHSALRDGTKVHGGDEVFWRKNGTSFPAVFTAYPVTEADFRGAVVTFNDVTERRRLEEQFRQAQKMEAVGQLAGGVAHDFNNLLCIINGYSDVLISRLKPDDPDRVLLDQIRKAGERSASLTRQLLAFSRKQVVVPKVIDLNAVVNDIDKLLQRLIGEDIKLRVQCDPGLDSIKADAGQIEQVILNLAVNARDAMPMGGELTIGTRNAADGVLLEVRDTGCGMTPEVMSHIFEPFFTTKNPGKGTGLGLATVYGIVQQAGGRIEVDSTPGQGTTFKISFPRAEVVVSRRSSHTGLKEKLGGTETILLVEDEDAVRSLTHHVLKFHGYQVLEASNAAAALQLCQRYRSTIHLLMTDVVMPGGMGGRQLADQVLAQRPDIKILYVSGYTNDAILRHGIAQDEVAFLQKPFTPALLVQKVREVLDGK